MEHDNLFIQILEILSIKHTEDFTIRFYESHPHKNNLFGLSEMLRYYNIENVAAEIQKTQENLSSLDVPFVAYVDHEFVLVRHVSTEAIIYSWRGKNITLSIPVFLERWSGIVLLFESTDESIDIGFPSISFLGDQLECLRLRIFSFRNIVYRLVAPICYICRDSEYNRITLYSVERMVPKI